jgi:Zn finger protein HypA/HybF involved in hydrogenase expression
MDPKTFTCPKCNNKFAILPMAREFPCPNCDAVLRIANIGETARKKKAYFIPLLISGLSYIIVMFILMFSTRDAGLLLQQTFVVSLVVLPIFFGMVLALNALEKHVRLEVVRLRQSCNSCGYIISIENSGFCPRCGASLQPGSQLYSSLGEKVGAPEVQQQIYGSMSIGVCMICGKEINRYDASVRCPGCESIFHKAHLLEYLHVHGGCPVCGKSTDEMEPVKQTPQEVAQLGERNK